MKRNFAWSRLVGTDSTAGKHHRPDVGVMDRVEWPKVLQDTVDVKEKNDDEAHAQG